jgi:NAD(P)-dependent dehydrogenase (short-subunit alcohol dehydrogenase family)
MLFTKFAAVVMGQSEYFFLNSSVSSRPASSTVTTIQKAVPLMTAGGSIVTVGSVAYKKGLPPMTVYSSAKAADRYMDLGPVLAVRHQGHPGHSAGRDLRP